MELRVEAIEGYLTFTDEVKGLGNRWAKNYKELLESQLKSFLDISGNISIKIHFYKRHVHKFQDIAVMWVTNQDNNSIRIAK